jgi:hypothetical protein
MCVFLCDYVSIVVQNKQSNYLVRPIQFKLFSHSLYF